MSNKNLTVLNPIAEAEVMEGKMAPRVSDLNGTKIGFLWNGKANGDVLLETIEENLSKKFNFKKILRRRKEDVSAGAYINLMNELVQNCDFVITAIGDCGSCSTWLILDAVRLEKRGIPTVPLCSHEFIGLAKLVTNHRGLPNLPIVVVPHPVGGLKREEVASKIDDRVMKEVIEILTERREVGKG